MQVPGGVNSIMRSIAVIFAALAGLLPASAWSLAVGEIDVKSLLNQPFVAQVPLVAATPSELEALQVDIASPAAYDEAGMERAGYLSSLQFALVPGGAGSTPHVAIRGKAPAREPFLDLLLEFRWNSGRLLRSYTVLLDPPAEVLGRSQAPEPTAPAQPPESVAAPLARESAPDQRNPAASDDGFRSGVGWVEPSSASEPRAPAPRAAMPQPASPAPADASASAGGDGQNAGATTKPVNTYGPIQRNETLWSIAMQVRPSPRVTMDQVQLALFRANPRAFDGNLNTLQTGVTLQVPSADVMTAVSAAEARREVARQRQAFRSQRPAASQPGTTAAAAAEPSSAKPARAPVVAAERPISDTTVATDDAQPAVSEPVRAGDSEPASASTPAESTASVAESAEASDGLADTAVSEAEQQSAITEPDAVADAGSSDTGSTEATTPAPSATETGDTAGMTALERLRAQREGRADVPPGQPSDQPPAADAPTAKPDDAQATTPAAPAEPRPAAPDASADSEASDAPSDSGGFPWLWIVIIALLAGGGAVYWRRRQAEADTASVTPEWPTSSDSREPASEAGAQAAAAHAPAAAGGDDDAEAAGNQSPSQTATAMFDAGSEDAESDDDALAATQVYSADDMEAAMAVPASDPEPVRASEATQQFHAETIQIDVSGDDPVSEADFHLAYGLYDEAAMLLQQAMEQDPARAEIKSKLAEVYFAGSQTDAFLDLAGQVKDDLVADAPGEWERVQIMGRQIAPDSPLFQETDGSSLTDQDVDLAFDDAEPDADTEAQDAGVADDADMALDFALDDEAPVDAPAPAAPVDEASHDGDDNVLEFDLEGFEPTPQPSDEGDTVSTDDDDLLAFSVDTDEAQTVDADASDDGAEPDADAAAEADPMLDTATDLQVDTDTDDPLTRPDGDAESAADVSDDSEPPAAQDDASDDTLAFDVESLTAEGDPDDAQADRVVDELGDFELDEEPVPASDPDDEGLVGEPEASDDAGTDSADVAGADDASGDFDIGDFDLDADETPAEPSDDARESVQSTDDTPLTTGADDFDLSSFDFGDDDAPASDSADDASLDLADFDLDQAPDASEQPPEEEHSLAADAAASDSSHDADAAPDIDFDAVIEDDPDADATDPASDAGNKLDLARAYLDMGDNDMARSLLDDVVNAGQPDQQAEARELMDRLGAG